MKQFLKILICSLLLGLTACQVAPVRYHTPPPPGYGPPPHAPAHGYRHKHGHAHLEFDTDLGLYIVLNRPEHYYYHGYYYHHKDRYWYLSRDLRGPWYHAGDKELPPGLRMKWKKRKHWPSR
jgi:hypothetical protein